MGRDQRPIVALPELPELQDYVILIVSAASGKEQFHSFDVAVFPAK